MSKVFCKLWLNSFIIFLWTFVEYTENASINGNSVTPSTPETTPYFETKNTATMSKNAMKAQNIAARYRLEKRRLMEIGFGARNKTTQESPTSQAASGFLDIIRIVFRAFERLVIKLLQKDKKRENIPRSAVLDVLSSRERRIRKKSAKGWGKKFVRLKYLIVNPLVKKSGDRDSKSRLRKSGVYKLQCANCNAYYIGKTGRKVSKRIKEHAFFWKNNISGKSAFATHLIENNHTFDERSNAELLYAVPKGKRLNWLEYYEIKRAGYKVLNKRSVYNETKIIDNILHKAGKVVSFCSSLFTRGRNRRRK